MPYNDLISQSEMERLAKLLVNDPEAWVQEQIPKDVSPELAGIIERGARSAVKSFQDSIAPALAKSPD